MAITFQPIGGNPPPATLETIVDDLLQGSGATLVAGSVSYIGANGQGSTFTDGAAAVGIASGLLLTSGSGTPAAANNQDNFGSSLGEPGDADLTAAADNLSTNDANLLSFQVLVSDPAVTSLTFTFVFASEEYPEFVDEYADIAAILVNGTNYALFANEQPLTVTSDNLEFFRRNTSDLLPDNTPPPGPQVSLPIEYDGVSRVFTVSVPVTLGVNTIKLGIADTTDSALDSALFIGSIVSSNAPPGPIITGSELAISPGTLSQPEGNVGPTVFSYTVTRTGDLAATSSVAWAVTGSGLNPASAADFTGGLLPSGTVTFNPGENSKTIQVSVNGDFATELDEGFSVTLSNAVNASITTGVASGTIVNDDVGGPTTLAISPPSLSQVEGDSGVVVYTYTVTRGGTVSGASTVNWAVSGFGSDPASAADFQGGTLPSGSLAFAIGETSKTIEVRVTGDLAFEPDETFQVSLSAPTGASIATGQALGGILNDDDPARPPVITTPAQTVVEGGVGQSTVLTYTVMRFGDVSQAQSGTWTVLEPASGASVNSVDLAALSGVVSFAAGAATAQLQVTVLGDATPESTEGFTLRVNLPGFDPLFAQGVIVNDDVVGGSAVGGAGGDAMVLSAPAAAFGLSGGDQMTGSGGDDWLDAGDGRDWVQAKGGDDRLFGGAGDDFLDGGAGFDVAGFDGRAADYAWWSNTDGSWTVRDLRAGGVDGVDLLYGVEQLQFADRTVEIAGLTLAQGLANAFENVLRRGPASAADQAFLADLSGRVSAGQWSMAQALDAIVDAADSTTAVALLSYQLFTGLTPGKGGIDWLVADGGGGNLNSLNSAYYAGFSLENRYINFAVNLGTVGEGRADFEATYGGMTLAQTFDHAYGRIFGVAAEAGKASAILDGVVSTGLGDITRADYFASYGGDALGTKAALVGWLLAEAAKADLGPYATASNAYLLDLADGAPFRVDLVGVYGPGMDGGS